MTLGHLPGKPAQLLASLSPSFPRPERYMSMTWTHAAHGTGFGLVCCAVSGQISGSVDSLD